MVDIDGEFGGRQVGKFHVREGQEDFDFVCLGTPCDFADDEAVAAGKHRALVGTPFAGDVCRRRGAERGIAVDDSEGEAVGTRVVRLGGVDEIWGGAGERAVRGWRGHREIEGEAFWIKAC